MSLSVINNIPIFLAAFVSATVAIQIMLRKNNNGFKSSVEEYIKKERLADKTYKHNFTDFPYVYPDKKVLPFREYGDKPEFKAIIKRQNICRKKSELEMICFDGNYSNTDLKLKYGKNNLDRITVLEEHYNSYVRSLFDWAKELIRLENNRDAQTVLEEAVRMKCDTSCVYTLLADLYYSGKDKTALFSLAEKAENTRINFKDKTISYIWELIENLK